MSIDEARERDDARAVAGHVRVHGQQEHRALFLHHVEIVDPDIVRIQSFAKRTGTTTAASHEPASSNMSSASSAMEAPQPRRLSDRGHPPLLGQRVETSALVAQALWGAKRGENALHEP